MNLNTKYGYDRNQFLNLCAMLLLAPALRLFPSATAEAAGRGAWLSAAAAIPFMLLYVLLLSRFMEKRREGEGLAELTLRCLGRRAGRAMLLLFSAWLLLYGGFVLRSGADRLITTVFPYSSPWVFALSMGLVCLFAALGPARSLFRSSKLVQPVVLGVLFFVLIFALFTVEKNALLPLVPGDTGPVFLGSLAAVDILSMVVYVSCFMIGPCPKTPGLFKATSVWTGLSLLLLTAMNTAIIGNLGAELVTKLTRPFFSLVRNMVFFNGLQRIEALVVALWIFPDFILVSTLLYSAQHSLRLFVTGESPAPGGMKRLDMGGKRWLILLCGGICLVCGVTIAPDPASLSFWSSTLIPCINLCFALIIVPLIFAVGKLRKAV